MSQATFLAPAPLPDTQIAAFRLPLPPRSLTPNSNIHWSAATKARAEYRKLAAEKTDVAFRAEKYRLSLTFAIKGTRGHCEHKRRPRKNGKPLRSCLRCPYAPQDESNALSAFKSGQDGIADALGISDSRKHLTIGEIRIDSSRGPYVEVTVEPIGGNE